jgi:hypothetical protein
MRPSFARAHVLARAVRSELLLATVAFLLVSLLAPLSAIAAPGPAARGTEQRTAGGNSLTVSVFSCDRGVNLASMDLDYWGSQCPVSFDPIAFEVLADANGQPGEIQTAGTTGFGRLDLSGISN